MSQNSKETPAPDATPMNFAKFLRTPFSQNNSEVESFYSDITQTMWHNLVCVECL